MLKMGKFGVLSALFAILPLHKKPNNRNETNFCNMPSRNIPNDARNPYKITSITMGNQKDLPDNAENLTNFGCIKPPIVKFPAFSMEYIWLIRVMEIILFGFLVL